MRSYLVPALIGTSVLASAALYSPLAAADPYYYRENSGTWTNVEYNDGACHYRFSHNAYDQETHLNRWGDCSRIAIGAGGEPVQLMPAPVFVPRY